MPEIPTTAPDPATTSASPRKFDLPDSVERLLTTEEAAFALGVSVRSFARYIASGDIEIVKLTKTVRIRPGALNRFIEARAVHLNPKRAGRKSGRPTAP